MKSVCDEYVSRPQYQLREHRGKELPGAAGCIGGTKGVGLGQIKRSRVQVLRDVVRLVRAGAWSAQDSRMRRIVEEN